MESNGYKVTSCLRTELMHVWKFSTTKDFVHDLSIGQPIWCRMVLKEKLAIFMTNPQM